MPADLTLVIPTYNECERIDRLLEQIFEVASASHVTIEVIVVDDNSSDGTGQRAEAWATRERVRVLHRPGKLGLGSAVLDGFAMAETDIIGVMDADLSHPPDLIPRLYATITGGDIDIVVASRYIPHAGTRNWPVGRLMLSRLACLLAWPITPVRDATSGFFLVRRSCLAGFQTRVRGFKIGLELLVRARPRSVAEVGYVFVNREAGKSKMTVSEGLGFLRQLSSLYASALLQNKRPGHRIVAGHAEQPAAGRIPV
ncbi:MAG: polyprenol monophosphomannose synthase [Acidobacteriaceae bacterium]|jgi:dolichol-phosphate mannosyltransferase|nr:polyprenol monophosphomannose synthase [Acidobacteriaceae bacterium]